MPQKIAVIGAGVGGLSAAARLAKKGYDVEVYEKLPNCGGRNNILEDRGFKFDTGPSFVLMPDFFEEVFDYCGCRLSDHLEFKVLGVNYRIFYPDGTSLGVYRDSWRTKDEIEKIERGASFAYGNFIAATQKIYSAVRPLLYTCFTRKSLCNPRYWPLLYKLDLFKSYWKLAKQFFKSEKLCYAFTFEAMFMGVSPFQAPGFYSIITYSDHMEKIRHPMGGMYRIPQALEKMAINFGVKFNYNCQAQRIIPGKDNIAIETDSGSVTADKVVVNADYAYAQSRLLGRELAQYKYSCSTYLIYLGLKTRVRSLEHHNLFFSGNLEENMRQIFYDKVIPSDPSFYVHVPTVTDSTLAPAGKEIFYILVPVPNLQNPRDDIAAQESRIRQAVFARINKIVGVNIEDLIEVEHRFYPEDFVSRYNIHYGATFGLSHNLTQSAFFRPANFDPSVKGLYYVGASTQPGGGLPVVIAGSRIVSDLIVSG